MEDYKTFELILDNITDCILFDSMDRKVLYANQQFCDFFSLQISPREMVGLDSEQVMKWCALSCKNPLYYLLQTEEIIKVGKIMDAELLELENGSTFTLDYTLVYKGEEKLGHLWTLKKQGYSADLSTDPKIVPGASEKREELVFATEYLNSWNYGARMDEREKRAMDFNNFFQRAIYPKLVSPLAVISATVEQMETREGAHDNIANSDRGKELGTIKKQIKKIGACINAIFEQAEDLQKDGQPQRLSYGRVAMPQA